MKLKVVKFIIAIASISYPFVLFFAVNFKSTILLLLGILWAIRGVFERGNLRLASFGLSGFFLFCILFKSENLAFLYPVIISLGFLFVFTYSLKSEAVITKLARVKERKISGEIISYTRNLTKIWCAFFAFNAVLSLWLSLIEDKIYWSLYTGVVSYILIFGLFGGEILYRKFFVLKGVKR
ncbi:DNA gyrase subunit B [Campylobacter sp.]|uniref:DNA gyrase subunit B n=1 Tax=Campylobacter sp. TaxID=205 RepID=UPI0026F5E600|nr:DNA gyrase subunit B [Campylobacter sp.]